MAKRTKRLNVTATDRLVGIQAHNKQDFLKGCNEPGRPWYQRDANQFTRTFCKVCRNHDCIRALGARTPWHDRMENQVEYLINNPIFSDMEKEEHREIASVVWDSLKQKAERLELARRRQDWEVPDAPTDGIDQVQSSEITDDVDEAVKRLARNAGKKEPELPTSEAEEAPAHFREQIDEEDGTSVVYETQYPSESRRGTYRVWLQADGLWQCECEGYKHVQKCKHLARVVPWYNENIRDREDDDDDDDDGSEGGAPAQSAPVAQQPPPQQPPPQEARAPVDPRVPQRMPLNTPMPEEGVMIGGGPAPQREVQRRPIAQPEKDPWAIPNDKIVQPGAKVVIKGKK